MKKIISSFSLLIFFSLIFSSCAEKNFTELAKPELIYGVPNAAIQGFDTVAYSKENKAVKGLAKHSFEYLDKVWFFSSEENLDDFIDDSEKYMPQYAGNCAYCLAVSNKKSPGSPNFWKIVDEKLYLNARKNVHELWLKDYQKFIKQSDQNWKTLKKK